MINSIDWELYLNTFITCKLSKTNIMALKSLRGCNRTDSGLIQCSANGHFCCI